MTEIEPMPEILYRYRVWNDTYHQQMITEQQVFLASPANLNDPFDASLPFRYDPAELTPENIFRKLIEVARLDNPELTETELHEMAYCRQYSGFLIMVITGRKSMVRPKKMSTKISVSCR